MMFARVRPYLVFVVAVLDFELKRMPLLTFIDSCNLVGLPEVNAQYAPFNLFAGVVLVGWASVHLMNETFRVKHTESEIRPNERSMSERISR